MVVRWLTNQGAEMREKSLERWRARMERAVALLNTRLDAPPTLQELADEVGVSPFHLHRVWRSLVGETVADTVRRLRLEASEELLKQQRSITETAMALGFGTPQSYARAFRRKTGTSPTEHRSAVADSPAGPRRMPEVTLEHRGEVLVVALRREGKPYTDLYATFGVVWNWATECGVIEKLTGIYGIPWDDPVCVSTDQLRYDACLSFGDVAHPAPPFRSLTLPAGPYARLRHQGSYEELESLDQYLVGEWLPESGREAADFPVFHQFLDDPEQVPVEALRTDVLLFLE